MRAELLELLESTGQLEPRIIVLRMLMGTVIGFFIYLSYTLSHEGSIYSKKFNVSLIALTTITTAVMIVIGNNIALSLGMVGALSIVRFRTAIKDSRDTIYIFWAIVVGICCGAGDFLVAGCGSAFTFLVLLILGRIKNDNRLLLIIRGSRVNEERIEALIFQYYARKANLRVKNTTQNTVELIYELSRRTMHQAAKPKKNGSVHKSITDAVYDIGGIEYCNLIVQNDEVSS
ncbi:DUF4956 domain-containing protein [uncultured Flavonifractor sp.]|uniref:DUF4956 domain-containing protein n=1 Tax=uncultured Flavonifractor sp. TaxID=1193534 RepID=UPI002628507B|nr:DUF4956 domain-containing protein [uncultured Flavonifractor sp.]